MKRLSIVLSAVGALFCVQQQSFAQSDMFQDSTESEINTNDQRTSLFDLSNHQVSYRDTNEEVDAILTANPSPISYNGGYEENSGGCCDPCCHAFWEHRDNIYGEFLYLTVRGANLGYATTVDGLAANAVPTSAVAIADPDYHPGFRAGVGMALDSCSSITGNFAFFESSHGSGITNGGGADFIRAELVHPNTTNVAADSLTARAQYDIDFQTADVNYKSLIWGGDNYALNYLLGLRYGGLRQDFLGRYTIVGVTNVETEVDFNGFGPRIGLEGERLIGKGLMVYFKSAANFLAGEFVADYAQNNIAVGQQALTGFEDDRIVPVLEFEIGTGWQSRCGKYRLNAGYTMSAWFNSVTTPNFINAVQQNNYVTDMKDTLTFDGLAARAEIRF